MDHLKVLIDNKTTFFGYMRERYPLFTHSNIFFRDIEYAIKYFFENRDIKLKYKQIEKITADFIKHLEDNKDMRKLSGNSWQVLTDFFIDEEQNESDEKSEENEEELKSA